MSDAWAGSVCGECACARKSMLSGALAGQGGDLLMVFFFVGMGVGGEL